MAIQVSGTTVIGNSRSLENIASVDATTVSTLNTALTGKQAADAELTAISGLATNGLITKTGNGTAATRTLTGTANQITVTNGDGVAGNPTIAAVVATQAEAEAGTDNTKLMTPLRVKQSISVNTPAQAPTTGQVLGATAGAVGAEVGSYTIAHRSTEANVGLGGTVAGSDLTPTSVFWRVAGTSSNRVLTGGGTLTGTWRAMAYYTHHSTESTNFLGATLWLRIA